jgi:hypothetical protein
MLHTIKPSLQIPNKFIAQGLLIDRGDLQPKMGPEHRCAENDLPPILTVTEESRELFLLKPIDLDGRIDHARTPSRSRGTPQHMRNQIRHLGKVE